MQVRTRLGYCSSPCSCLAKEGQTAAVGAQGEGACATRGHNCAQADLSPPEQSCSEQPLVTPPFVWESHVSHGSWGLKQPASSSCGSVPWFGAGAAERSRDLLAVRGPHPRDGSQLLRCSRFNTHRSSNHQKCYQRAVGALK